MCLDELFRLAVIKTNMFRSQLNLQRILQQQPCQLNQKRKEIIMVFYACHRRRSCCVFFLFLLTKLFLICCSWQRTSALIIASVKSHNWTQTLQCQDTWTSTPDKSIEIVIQLLYHNFNTVFVSVWKLFLLCSYCFSRKHPSLFTDLMYCDPFFHIKHLRHISFFLFFSTGKSRLVPTIKLLNWH